MTEANMLIEDVASTDATKIIKQVLFSGQLDESNIDEKAQAIYQIITQFPKNLNLIFDFEKLEYMNSKSIGYLTDWYGKVTEGGGHLVIIKAKPNIVDILSVIGLTQLIPMFGSLDEAKYSLLNAPVAAPAPAAVSQPVISTNAPVEAPVAAPAPTPAEPVVAPTPAAPVQTPEPVVVPAPVAPTPVEPVVVPPAPVLSEPAPVAPTPAPVVATPAPEVVVTPVPAPIPTPAPEVAPETPAAPPINLA